MKIKKLDYIIFYVITLMFFFGNISVPAEPQVFITCFIIALIPSLILGTITNLVRLIFKKLTSWRSLSDP